MTMHLSTITAEKVLQKSLPYFFALVFITTIAGALSGYLRHDAFKIGDWLINYQGGMVRRGLLGEVIYQLSYFTHINPGLYVILFQIFFYAVFLFFSFALLKKQQILLPYALLIFSPFIFTFQINDLQGGFRKEIIYFAFLAFITWSVNVKEYKIFEKIFYITLLLYPAVILTHEMLAIFLPYILVVYFSVTTLSKKKFFLISLLLAPSITSLIASIYYSGTAFHVTEIFDSIARENYTLEGGAISWLDKSFSFGVEEVINAVNNAHYIPYYLLIIVLSLFAYVPLYKNLNIIIKNRLSLSMVLLSIIGSFTLFIIAIDWGRIIYIHLISIFFLLLIPAPSRSNNDEDRFQQPPNLLKMYVIIFFVIYSLLWRVPHCCSPIPYAQNYKQLNIVAFARPYAHIFIYISPYFKPNFE